MNSTAQDGSTGGPEVGPPPGGMEAAAGAMERVALETPPPGEMPPGGMPADEIEADAELNPAPDEADS